MTGREFENICVDLMKQGGAWVHRFSESNTGSQPFDIFALHDVTVYAYDCKVISTQKPYFPFSRIELNQRNSMRLLREKFKGRLHYGFMIYHDGNIFYLKYEDFVRMEKEGHKGVNLKDLKIISTLNL